MKAPTDKKTLDLLPEHDLAGERPRAPTSQELARQRVERFREKHGVKPVTLQLPAETLDLLNYMTGNTGESKSQLVARVLADQAGRAGGQAVVLPVEVRDEFAAWVVAKGKGRSAAEVLEKLIRTQLLRPR